MCSIVTIAHTIPRAVSDKERHCTCPATDDLGRFIAGWTAPLLDADGSSAPDDAVGSISGPCRDGHHRRSFLLPSEHGL
jgi:hypothetical protein